MSCGVGSCRLGWRHRYFKCRSHKGFIIIMSCGPFLGKVVSKTTSEAELIATSQADKEAFDPNKGTKLLLKVIKTIIIICETLRNFGYPHWQLAVTEVYKHNLAHVVMGETPQVLASCWYLQIFLSRLSEHESIFPGLFLCVCTR